MKEIKKFFYDCMLFQNNDKELRLIGVLVWIDVIGWICLFCSRF